MSHATLPSISPSLLLCWGKTTSFGHDYHPALYHLLDVGHVARQLLSDPASPRLRTVLAEALAAEPEQLADWLPWLIALHDIGKFSVPFQAQDTHQLSRLRAAGFEFSGWTPTHRLHHTHMGQIVLRTELTYLNMPPYLLRAWDEMLGGHHGSYASNQNAKDARSTLRAIGEPPQWAEWRQEAARLLETILLRHRPAIWPQPDNLSAAVAALTGFTILCDWLGSDARHFEAHSQTDLPTYILHSQAQALRSVTTAGFLQPTLSAAPTPFAQLFPDRAPGRPLQRAIDHIPDDVLRRPCLAIIEAPTGEGKTEAALTLAHRIGRLRGTDEFYCALPTTATSNQMFARLGRYLVEQLQLSTGVKLIHGQAFLIEDDLNIQPMRNGPYDSPQAALEWFGPKKRSLLAPFGVGTIDQAELTALNVRHQALRLIGLAGKTVILDEVHAYDAYMTTIIERMLHWLRTLGASVILLSATLPLERRAALATAYGLPGGETLPTNDDYPSLWIGSPTGIYQTSPPAYRPTYRLDLGFIHWPHNEPAAKATWLLQQIAAGGCVCWIANTVRRAQELFAAIRTLDDIVPCDLLHAQFPLEDRHAREARIAAIYGPEGHRPARGIVIGTQVLEQSLDLDFDLMVSDLAPIDLLLQRAGRLHRHDRDRPPTHRAPRLWIEAELDTASELQMGADRFYTEYLLRHTWETLHTRSHIQLPQDYRPLVETIYSPPPPDSPLAAAWQELRALRANERQEALERLVGPPTPSQLFTIFNRIEFEEDEDAAAWIVAQTRLGPETITVIPLTRDGSRARVTCAEWVDLSQPAPRATQLRLLRRGVRLSQSTAVRALQSDPAPLPPMFTQSPLLRRIRPLWLESGGTRLTAGNRAVTLHLDPDLGLVVERQPRSKE